MVKPRVLRGALIGALALLHGCVGVTDDCPKGFKDCGDVCSNLKLDPANCGACGNKCAKGEVCNDSQCGLPCGFPEDQRCDGVCVRFNDNNAHCGECHNACAASQFCFDGECRANSF